MHFDDLTPYAYGRTEPDPNVLNVGWLSADHPFPVGPPNARFIEALRRLTMSPVNFYRGSHACDLCPAPPYKLSPGGIPMRYPPPETLGNGEIRVVGRNGKTYVAPILVLHYVSVHGYLPPQEFVDAVFAT
jgi:hypothetical protein